MVPHSHITGKANVSGTSAQYTLDQIESSKQEPLKLRAIIKKTSSAILKRPEHRMGEQLVLSGEKVCSKYLLFSHYKLQKPLHFPLPNPFPLLAHGRAMCLQG